MQPWAASVPGPNHPKVLLWLSGVEARSLCSEARQPGFRSQLSGEAPLGGAGAGGWCRVPESGPHLPSQAGGRPQAAVREQVQREGESGAEASQAPGKSGLHAHGEGANFLVRPASS